MNFYNFGMLCSNLLYARGEQQVHSPIKGRIILWWEINIEIHHVDLPACLPCPSFFSPSHSKWEMVLNGLQWSSDGIPRMWNLRESFPVIDKFSVFPSLDEGHCVHYGSRDISVGMGYRMTRPAAKTVSIAGAKPSFRLVHSLLMLHVCLVVATHHLCVSDCVHLELTLHAAQCCSTCSVVLWFLFQSVRTRTLIKVIINPVRTGHTCVSLPLGNVTFSVI